MTTVSEMAESLLSEDDDDGHDDFAEAIALGSRIVIATSSGRWEAYRAAALQRDGCIGVCLRKVAGDAGGAERLHEPMRARMEREQRERADERPAVAQEAGAAIDADMRRILVGPTDVEVAEQEAAQARVEAQDARAAADRARDGQGRFTSGSLDGGSRTPLPGPGQNPNQDVNAWLRGGGVGEMQVSA